VDHEIESSILRGLLPGAPAAPEVESVTTA
jgi:hypothetical protein